MHTVYSICAVLGGTVLLCQFVMALIGLSGDHGFADADGEMDFGDAHSDAGGDAHSQHHSSTWFFGVISFRTAVAALAFFGLTGLAVTSSGAGGIQGLTMAFAAGIAAMFGVHWLMQQMSRLNADGTVRTAHAVGQTGTVYLRIPGHNQGAGKIVLNLHNRTVEIAAETAGDEIPTGAQVVVLGVVGPDVVEVRRATSASISPSPSNSAPVLSEVTHA